MKPLIIRGHRRFTSVRSRLTMWNVLALTVALTAVSLQIRYSVRANIIGSIDRELSSMERVASRMNRGRGRGFGGFVPNFPNNPPRSSRPFRPDIIPSVPTTRVFINGDRTFFNEPPWDQEAYNKALFEAV